MTETMNQALIETTVKQAIKRIQDDPERSIRNLVDMGLLFSNGKFQQRFLEVIQQMLQNEQSSYYRLISDLIANVDSKRITTFAINLGYNSCTRGARMIRKIESEQGYNVPWSIFLTIDDRNFRKHEDEYFSLFEQGQSLGVYTWFLFSNQGMESCLKLAEKYTDNAFLIFCHPNDITPALLDEAVELYNIMFVVAYENETDQTCNLLRKRNFLYSIYYSYTEDDMVEILNGNILADIQELHPVFTLFHPSNDCPLPIQQLVYEFVLETRMKQNYITIPFDLIHDMKYIDEIISEDASFIFFDKNGFCFSKLTGFSETTYNFLEYSLVDMLKSIVPKC